MTQADDLLNAATVHDLLGVRVLELSVDKVVLEMDVTPRVHQPMGLLHGGISAVLAESAASMGAFMNCQPNEEIAVGTDLNISHLRAKKEGVIRATATPIRKGKTIHVWSIDITDEADRMIAVARLTVAIRRIVGKE